MLVYGSGLGDGNRHNHNDLPILLAGRGGGTIQTGRHLKFETQTPLNNLYLSHARPHGHPRRHARRQHGALDRARRLIGFVYDTIFRLRLMLDDPQVHRWSTAASVLAWRKETSIVPRLLGWFRDGDPPRPTPAPRADCNG